MSTKEPAMKMICPKNETCQDNKHSGSAAYHCHGPHERVSGCTQIPCNGTVCIPYKEAPMKYEIVKPVSCESVYRVLRTGRGMTKCEKEHFDHFSACFLTQGYVFSQPIHQRHLLEYLNVNHIDRDWLIDKGFIREAKPKFPIMLPIETEEEATAVWHRLDVSPAENLREYGRRNGFNIPGVTFSVLPVDPVWERLNAIYSPTALHDRGQVD